MPDIDYNHFKSDRYFGVEMEFNEMMSRYEIASIIRSVDPRREVEVSNNWTVTGAYHGVNVTSWSVKTDSTCADDHANYGNEVASPKMRSLGDIETIGLVAASLKSCNCGVNDRCGVHVHADISDFVASRAGVMIAWWLKIEWVVAQSIPVHRRNNKYSQLMRLKHRIDYNRKWTGEELYMAVEPTNLDVHQNLQKRVAINLVGYATGRRNHAFTRKTAECRLLEGTTDREDIENWTLLFVHFVGECKHKEMPSDLRELPLGDALRVLGLAGNDNFLLLSPELHRAKSWFLKRVVKYTKDPSLFKDAVAILNSMHAPFEQFVIENKNDQSSCAA